MGEILNQPFVSEAYDRLMAEQAAHKVVSTLLDERAPSRAMALLHTPIADIKAIREQRGMSQSQFAELIGVDAPRISAWENGKPLPLYIDMAVRCLLAIEALR